MAEQIRLGRWHDKQFHLAAFRSTPNVLHHRQSAVGSRADDEPPTLPGDVFFDGQGMSPNSSRKRFEAFFLRSRISPRSITTSESHATPSIWIEPKEKLLNCTLHSPCIHALFDLITLKALDLKFDLAYMLQPKIPTDERCSTFLLPHFGQTTR